jgi:hypothetical protein
MFEEFRSYPKEKVKTYLRYLASAAAKQNAYDLAHRVPEPFHDNINIEKRLSQIDEDRRDELELKVNSFYTKNRYMPLLVRIKKIKNRYMELKRSGSNKKKLLLLREKIEKCHNLIKKMEKLDMMRETMHGIKHENPL